MIRKFIEVDSIHLLTFSIRKLFRWWGRYFESRGKMDEAAGCYRKADDNLSLCRLLCEQDQPTKVEFFFGMTLTLELYSGDGIMFGYGK